MNTTTAARIANAATSRLVHTLKEWDEIATKRELTAEQAVVIATIKAELIRRAA